MQLLGTLVEQGYKIMVRFAPRECNHVADQIAKHGRKAGKTIIWRTQPAFVDKSMFEDAQMIRRVRRLKQ
jgi:hypothetical protein